MNTNDGVTGIVRIDKTGMYWISMVDEYKNQIRKELLLELSKVFLESLNTEWHNFEISDFLDNYK